MIQYKLEHENAKPPERGSTHAAGFDLYAAEILRDNNAELWIDTGVAFDIPHGMYGDLRARSSVSETGLILCNGAGVVDSDYTGSVQFRFYKVAVPYGTDKQRSHKKQTPYQVGDRIGQVIFQSHYTPDLSETDEISDTDRGNGGFGSTGK